ncbi:hypothetical protein GSB9_01819 [Flavobacteriaceae bacterium GSB9]|nr:hypothetical protein GSB9_01819 [Flavobacteriaceae bacterium GSB9]
MKRLFLYVTLMVASVAYAQQIDHNLKSGYMAKGYDVVAYFNNQAIEGTDKYKTLFDGVWYRFHSKKI